jgi:hypothetical protein
MSALPEKGIINRKRKGPQKETQIKRNHINSDLGVDDFMNRVNELYELLEPIDDEMTQYDLAISDITSVLDKYKKTYSARYPPNIQEKINSLSERLANLNHYKSVLEAQAKPYVLEKNQLLSKVHDNPNWLKKAMDITSQSVGNAVKYVANKLNDDGTVKYKNANFASRVIDSIATDNLSIFDTYAKIRQGAKVPKDYIKHITDNTLTIYSSIHDPPQFKQELIDAVKDKNNPIVILVTSKVHAIIYIIHEGKKYTVGYGYNGSGDESLKANQFANKVRETRKSYAKNIKKPLAHMIEYLPGALYTADYLVPEDNDVANISWITFLDENIIEQMQEMLDNTTEIAYNIENGYIEDQAIIRLDQNYSEGIQIMKPFVGLNGYNCIVWAEKVLGVKGLCGLISNPSTCPSVTQDEWNDVYNNMNDPPALIGIIQDIQCRLRPNFCTSLMRSLRVIKGGKKTRKNKKTNRRKRYNKTRK